MASRRRGSAARHDTRLGAVARATDILRSAGVDTPQLDAEILLRHALGESREDYWRRLREPIPEEARSAFRGLLERRAAREPVAYITGRKAFYGLELEVDRRVLIPRPETEQVVEAAVTWAKEQGAASAADIGTGSGAIALALAAALPRLRVYAVERSSEALEVARQNAHRLGLADRVAFLEGDLTRPLPLPVDLIAANLPYVASGEIDGLPPEIRRYEPLGGLVAGPRGTEVIEALLEEAAERLRPGGALFVEIDASQAEVLAAAARRAFPGARVEVRPDLAGLPRVLCALRS